MQTSICGWLKRNTTAMVVIVLCTLGLGLIVWTAFNMNRYNEVLNRFGIGIFAGGVTYAASRIDKTSKKPKLTMAIMLIIGLILIGSSLILTSADKIQVGWNVSCGIGIGMCVGSITYYASMLETIKKRRQALK